jgi:hypothetical protein
MKEQYLEYIMLEDIGSGKNLNKRENKEPKE